MSKKPKLPKIYAHHRKIAGIIQRRIEQGVIDALLSRGIKDEIQFQWKALELLLASAFPIVPAKAKRKAKRA